MVDENESFEISDSLLFARLAAVGAERRFLAVVTAESTNIVFAVVTRFNSIGKIVKLYVVVTIEAVCTIAEHNVRHL